MDSTQKKRVEQRSCSEYVSQTRLVWDCYIYAAPLTPFSTTSMYVNIPWSSEFFYGRYVYMKGGRPSNKLVVTFFKWTSEQPHPLTISGAFQHLPTGLVQRRISAPSPSALWHHLPCTREQNCTKYSFTDQNMHFIAFLSWCSILNSITLGVPKTPSAVVLHRTSPSTLLGSPTPSAAAFVPQRSSAAPQPRVRLAAPGPAPPAARHPSRRRRVSVAERAK